MNNERFTETTTITIDDCDYRIEPIPTDDRACLRLMLELQRDAAFFLLQCATHDLRDDSFDNELTQFDYSGDHDDYNPAAADLLAAITATLSYHMHDTARAALIELITAPDSTFCADICTIDFNTPLAELIADPELDD